MRVSIGLHSKGPFNKSYCPQKQKVTFPMLPSVCKALYQKGYALLDISSPKSISKGAMSRYKIMFIKLSKRKGKEVKSKVNRSLYYFILPALLLYVVFWVSPVLMSFYYGFTDWSGVGDYKFVGLDNFQFLMRDGTLLNALKNTGIYTLFTVIFGNVLALVLAFILNMKMRLKGAFRTTFYIPALFSTVVVAFIWSYVYAPYYGMIYSVFDVFGAGESAPNLLGGTGTALIACAFVEQWKTCGTMTLIYLAGLQNLPDEVIESAKIDGCKWYQEMFKVKIPMLANTIAINVMLGLINGFKSFDYVFTLTGGGPGNSSSTLMYSVYKLAFVEYQYGTAEALAASAFVLILVVSCVVLYFFKKREVEA